MDWSGCGSSNSLTVPAGVRVSAAQQACALVAANMPAFLAHACATTADNHETPEATDVLEHPNVVSSHWRHYRVKENDLMNEAMATGKRVFLANNSGDAKRSAMTIWRSVVNLHVRGEEAVTGSAGRLLVDFLIVNAHLRGLAAQVRPAKHGCLPGPVVHASLGLWAGYQRTQFELLRSADAIFNCARGMTKS